MTMGLPQPAMKGTTPSVFPNEAARSPSPRAADSAQQQGFAAMLQSRREADAQVTRAPADTARQVSDQRADDQRLQDQRQAQQRANDRADREPGREPDRVSEHDAARRAETPRHADRRPKAAPSDPTSSGASTTTSRAHVGTKLPEHLKGPTQPRQLQLPEGISLEPAAMRNAQPLATPTTAEDTAADLGQYGSTELLLPWALHAAQQRPAPLSGAATPPAALPLAATSARVVANGLVDTASLQDVATDDATVPPADQTQDIDVASRSGGQLETPEDPGVPGSTTMARERPADPRASAAHELSAQAQGPGRQADLPATERSAAMGALSAWTAAASSATTSSTAQAPATGTAASTSAHLPTPAGSPGFAGKLAQQLNVWVRDGIQQAALTLNPAELGTVTVRIAMEGQQARVDFTAANAQARDALQASLPALGTLFAQAGLELAGADVSTRHQHDQPQAGQTGRGDQPSDRRTDMAGNPSGPGADDGSLARHERANARALLGGLDLYA